MANGTLLAVKNAGEEGNWTYYFSLLGKIVLSDGYFMIFNELIEIEKLNGGRISQETLWSDVTVRDDSDGGTVYTPFSEENLQNILLSLNCPLYRYKQNFNAAALISTDANNQIILGSDQLLYVPPGGGGGNAYRQFESINKWNTGDSLDFDLENGLAINVFIDRQPVFTNDSEEIPFASEWEQDGNILTLSEALIDTYLFDGSLICITGIQLDT